MSLANRPAFARPGYDVDIGTSQCGMTFRQYAAVHILAGYVASGASPTMTSEHLAQCATAVTDALIAELEKPTP